jgi:succinate dehydrogenase / fumarate reductase iron-sulfur subunit
METREAFFQISRFSPERDKIQHFQTFDVKIDNRMSVLDALENIKHEQDSSLTFRRSCRSGICGSCAMRINGLAKLACKTKVKIEVDKHGEVIVEPIGNMPPIRDLVVDMTEFWHEVDRGTPWLIWDESLRDSGKENLLTDEQLQVPGKLADCIMCGACFSDCVSRVFDKNFTGPASLAKIRRFVADPRDKVGARRVPTLIEMGLWSCTHCYFCWSQCPRDVRPVAAISELRALSFSSGDASQGSRHVQAFKDSVKASGMLNETTLFLKTMRLKLLQDVDVILRMTTKGKAPSPFPRPVPRIKEVRSLYRVAKEAQEK